MSDDDGLDLYMVCREMVQDIRQVGVECGYAVDESVPEAEKRSIFREVPADASVFEPTRRYPAGTVDRLVITKTGANSNKIDTLPEYIEPIRLVEQTVYSITCCKNCRGDFIGVFQKWAQQHQDQPA
jgi:hypothetical protein